MKKKGGCKLIGLVTVLAMAFGIAVNAAEPAINPAQVTTGRAVLYGTAPLKIGSTEFTEAQLSAAKAGTVPLANTKILIGSAGGVAAAQTVSGDATLAANGALSIAAGVIVNADIATNAAIAASKLNFGGTYVTNTVITADAKTNTIILEGVTIKSWTIAE